ncbi:N-acetylmuramoyl-L-alanine amidase [Halodesulfovibrio marinisediminis]|uniref:N-acetylmuramoyl-L-alanine amidase n=1 Tax=Halodesulfovibrio marinisediminis DSM 17456 TaxID=1121457 RepID=A0A1N6IVT4_9BACT|nr:N-acetylmuramoyl-L-alanine amidase [Halodesulfovibrio marinisediminis]SIO36149.1 N-acetylmuramoyl-L-alanine amidase [Halodesulfovibrio marinisediminis DSM 17456]
MLITRKKGMRCLPLLLLFLLLSVTDSYANISRDYQTALNQFRSLVKNSKQARYRSNWKRLEDKFIAIYQANPDGSYAPKVLYYMGRVNEELARRSYLRSDYQAAVDYYNRCSKRFTRHSWTDDALYRMARVQYYNLNQSAEARKTLNTILSKYQAGDKYKEALALHRKILSEVRGGTTASKSPQKHQPTSHTTTTVSKPRKASNKVALKGIRFTSSNDYTRVVIDLSGEAKHQYKFLNADPVRKLPFRLYIDLDGTVPSQAVKDELKIYDGILQMIRVGKPVPGTSRVVLDFESVQKYTVFALENPYRVVVDVSAPKDGNMSHPPVDLSRKPSVQKPKKPSRTVPPSRKIPDLIEQLGLTVKTVMIDAGHGGKDPGAAKNRIREKDYVLNVAKMLGKKLKAKGFNVLYTRSSDVFIPLEERTAKANVQKVDLFVSLHINASRKSRVNGIETYYLNLARSKSARRIAARENAISEKRISDLQFILTDLMLNSKMQESKALAELVQKSMVKKVRAKGWKSKSNGVRSAPFYVLMGAKMPSILVELGYCSNPTEAKRLRNNSYLNLLADGIADALSTYRTNLKNYAAM